MPRMTKKAYDEIAERQRQRTAQVASDHSLRAWLSDANGNLETSIDASGNLRHGAAQPQAQPDPFGQRLQDEKQDLRQWSQSEEGQQALADEAEAQKPKPQLWESSDGMWHFKTSTGTVYTDSDKTKLIELLIFGDRTAEEIKAEMSEFLAKTPDYVRDPLVWSLLAETLLRAERPLTAENLALAWQTIKPAMQRKGTEVALRTIQEIEEAAERRAYFDRLSTAEVDEAMFSIAAARKSGLI